MLLIGLSMVLVCLVYTGLMICFTSGWFRLKQVSSENSHTAKPVTVSVVISARNEETLIAYCLSDLSCQDYAKELLEIIIVDDHSNDHTAVIVSREAEKTQNIRLIQLESLSTHPELVGKKAALNYGILHAKGELIITSDADCRFPCQWVSTLVAFFIQNQYKLISGPVEFEDKKKGFNKFQQLEFLSLVASGAASAGMGKPLMCNGANLAFTREAYLLVQPQLVKNTYTSGDDMFLMLAIKKQYGAAAIGFIKSNEIVVKTQAATNLRSFIAQRLRWVSKSSGYNDPWVFFVAIITYLTSFSILASSIMMFCFAEFRQLFYIPFILKLIADFPLLWLSTSYFKKRNLLWYYLPFQMVYIFYVSLIGLAGNLFRFRWKGRSYKN